MVPGVQALVAHDRHLRLVADSPVPSVISDPRLPDNPIVACNSAFCDLTGYSTEEVVGRNCRFLSGPGTEPWLTEEIRRGVREHRPVLVEILNYKRNGQPFRNAVLVAPIYDEHDALVYFLGSQVEFVSCSTGTPHRGRFQPANPENIEERRPRHKSARPGQRCETAVRFACS